MMTKMQITRKQLRQIIKEAHGLSKSDADKVKALADETDDSELKRILKFIVKSNVEVDKTQDVTKMKKESRVTTKRLERIIREEIESALLKEDQQAAIREFMQIMQTPGLSSGFAGEQRWMVQPGQITDESAVPQDTGSFSDTLLLARLPRNEFQSISPASTRMKLEIRVDDQGEVSATVVSSADRRMVSQVQRDVDEIFEYDWPEDKRQVILDLAPGLDYQLETVPSNVLIQK